MGSGDVIDIDAPAASVLVGGASAVQDAPIWGAADERFMCGKGELCE
jgi:hypothetical protein